MRIKGNLLEGITMTPGSGELSNFVDKFGDAIRPDLDGYTWKSVDQFPLISQAGKVLTINELVFTATRTTPFRTKFESIYAGHDGVLDCASGEIQPFSFRALRTGGKPPTLSPTKSLKNIGMDYRANHIPQLLALYLVGGKNLVLTSFYGNYSMNSGIFSGLCSFQDPTPEFWQGIIYDVESE